LKSKFHLKVTPSSEVTYIFAGKKFGQTILHRQDVALTYLHDKD